MPPPDAFAAPRPMKETQAALLATAQAQAPFWCAFLTNGCCSAVKGETFVIIHPPEEQALLSAANSFGVAQNRTRMNSRFDMPN